MMKKETVSSVSYNYSDHVDDKLPLHLVKFSNGNCKLNAGIKMDFHCFTSPDLNLQSKRKRILMASGNKLQYTGNNYESDVSKVTSSVLKIGVYNKNSHRMKVYDADFFCMKRVLKQNCKATNEEKTKKQMSDDLNLTFGSKNKKRMINTNLSYATGSSDNMEDTISQKIKEGVLDTNEQSEQDQIVESEIIPHQNENASSASEVYNINDLISEDEYNGLESQARIFTSFTQENLIEWKNENKFCPFIFQCLEIGVQSISLHKAKLICYLNYLINLIQCKYKEIRRKDPIPNVPEPYKKKLLETYLINKCMPQRMKDKLLAHAMIIALSINDYVIDWNTWCQSTNVNGKRLTLMSYSLGCHIHKKKGEDNSFILLKLPLYKIEERKASKRRQW